MQPLGVFWEKDVFLKTAALTGEAALRILEKYLLRGSLLVKLQASSLMSKKIKNMHEWSLVINLFWWLTICVYNIV